MLVMLSGPIPVLVNVTVWLTLVAPTWMLPNVSDPGDTLAACATPVPVKLTVWMPAPSTRTSVANLVPVEVGLNATSIVQLEFAATLVPQVLLV